MSLQKKYQEPITTMCSHPSYLFDNSVRVVEEGQGDDRPGGDGETQEVPGMVTTLYGSCHWSVTALDHQGGTEHF